ncbi:MAG: hypothetical protein IJS44_04675 [Clostridia bacterium]|nr:hypothetical protein [Clostridia bacterium]
MTEIIQSENGHILCTDGKPVAAIPGANGTVDTFEKIEDGAWKWHRRTSSPTDQMRMEVILLGGATFTMVPAVSYNGNGWGKTPEYVGDRAEDGTPWSWASHRVTIPACTYSENEQISLALMAEPNSNSACSLYRVDAGEKHVLIFPEEEKPKTLNRHFWGAPYQGTMAPKCDFFAVLFAAPSDGGKHRYRGMLDFAWRYYAHEIKPPRPAHELYRLSIAYARYLLQKEKDGFIGFTSGAQWIPKLNGYQKAEHGYELGWVGQNASFATAFINDYIENGDKENLEIGLAVLDGWLSLGLTNDAYICAHKAYRGAPDPKLDLPFETMTRADLDPWDFPEGTLEGIIPRLGKPRPAPTGQKKLPGSDACNLGTGAEGYFEAYDLLKSIGIDRPKYLEMALRTCDFALKSQDEDGSFAKSWTYEGTVASKKGTIGCFLILPLLNAHRRTGDRKYLDGAIRAFDFYYAELDREGYTTAGALDTYSIDKESASPLLRDALTLYETTKDKKYIGYAEKIAWYLCTWMMHFTVEYPVDCLIKKLDYDTFGATSVSTPHNALDQYALRDVLSFMKLYELTGFVQWKERALAFWCNACQGISDGTLYINERLRPVGSQDEAIFHTRWGRYTVPAFTPSQWLASWPAAFRLENLRWHKDWSLFDAGLTHIEGALGGNNR